MAVPNVVTLMIGKKDSRGVPGKNTLLVLGRPLCEYPLIAASESKYIHKIYVSTDSPLIMEVASKYMSFIIERPSGVQDSNTLVEDVVSHAYDVITHSYNDDPDIVCLLFANAPFISGALIDAAIDKLLQNPEYDSCVGVCRADMFAPVRAVKMQPGGELSPIVNMVDFASVSSHRDSVGSTYFIDLSLQILRKSCFTNGMVDKTPPYMWLGNRRLGFEKEFGFDLDAKWQVPIIKEWLCYQDIKPKVTEMYQLQ